MNCGDLFALLTQTLREKEKKPGLHLISQVSSLLVFVASLLACVLDKTSGFTGLKSRVGHDFISVRIENLNH